MSKEILEIQSYLMRKMGYGCSAEGYSRKLKIGICRGYYSSVSSVLIEVEGSPVRGRAIVWSDADFNESPSQCFNITIQQKEGRFRTHRKFYHQKDDPNLISGILKLAFQSIQEVSK